MVPEAEQLIVDTLGAERAKALRHDLTALRIAARRQST